MSRNNQGLWLSSFQQGLAANRPVAYPGDGNVAFYFATDTGILSVAPFVAGGGNAVWTDSLFSYNSTKHTLVLPNIPTASTGLTAGMVWSNAGVLTIV